ncbi:hypothetical protein EDEG_02165 [Edhazardia aedis USNM 41457]|uniref:Uncharacterized protein n=1 Tax=Edhazardia aedis (strain USNM 41457) TaxID=1003232 RepID=J9D7L0_EDHAE|nr:hypothetical protein EDEG_02165 [Edhazardia aedis USNM 41457]|eukprot:EJW03509.1 hypothetical protein EDEG_02165 [Edhazardia aedis USNM 41457]
MKRLKVYGNVCATVVFCCVVGFFVFNNINGKSQGKSAKKTAKGIDKESFEQEVLDLGISDLYDSEGSSSSYNSLSSSFGLNSLKDEQQNSDENTEEERANSLDHLVLTEDDQEIENSSSSQNSFIFDNPRPEVLNPKDTKLQDASKNDSNNFFPQVTNTQGVSPTAVNLREEYYKWQYSFNNIIIKIPAENEYFSVSLREEFTFEQSSPFLIEIKNISETNDFARWTICRRPAEKQVIENDMDSNSESDTCNLNDAKKNERIGKDGNIEDDDLESFYKEWIENYNRTVQSETEKVVSEEDEAYFDDIITKMLAEKNTSELEAKLKAFNYIKKNKFDDVLNQVILNNAELIQKIRRKLISQEVKGKCIQLYMCGRDFQMSGYFTPNGNNNISKQKRLLIAAIGRELLRNDASEDLKSVLDKFSKEIYSQKFKLENSCLNLKIKKAELVRCQSYFKNPCLIKILHNALFHKSFDQNMSSVEDLYDFSQALQVNLLHDLIIIFDHIRLETDDIKELIFNNKYLSQTEVIFSCGFFLHSEISQNSNGVAVVKNIKKLLEKWCIKIPGSLIDPTDSLFMKNPYKTTNSSNLRLLDEMTIYKQYNSTEKKNPITDENIYNLNDYKPAEKLMRAWERLKKRMGKDFEAYFLFIENERFLSWRPFLNGKKTDGTSIFDPLSSFNCFWDIRNFYPFQ